MHHRLKCAISELLCVFTAMSLNGMKVSDSMNEVGYSFNQNHLQCRFCSKLFRKRRNVARHERIHTGAKPYNCEVCGRQFSDQSTLRQHANVHNEKMFLCDDCGKPFRSRNGLKYHRCSIYILYKKPPISRWSQSLRQPNYHPRQFTRDSGNFRKLSFIYQLKEVEKVRGGQF